jgi:hypothetical protein
MIFHFIGKFNKILPFWAKNTHDGILQEYRVFKVKPRAPTTLKPEGEVTSLSGADKREVRDNREKSKYLSNCTTFHIHRALSWHSYVIYIYRILLNFNVLKTF